MNNRIWFYSCTDQSTAQCVNEQDLRSVQKSGHIPAAGFAAREGKGPFTSVGDTGTSLIWVRLKIGLPRRWSVQSPSCRLTNRNKDPLDKGTGSKGISKPWLENMGTRNKCRFYSQASGGFPSLLHL